MKIILVSYFLIHLILIYLFSLGQTIKILLKKLSIDIPNIILGYSLIVLNSYYLYFFIKLENNIINLILLLFSVLIIFNFKNYLKKVFFNLNNIYISLIIIFFTYLSLNYGEQFYVFRGNYWDSFNYLSSAHLFKNYNYSEVLSNSFSNIYNEFIYLKQSVSGRPLVNYLLSLFLNFKIDIFFSYYLFKIFLSILIFITLDDLLVYLFNLINFKSKLISFIYILSFWNIYIFEIDALSHLASIPLLLVLVKIILKKYNEPVKNLNQNLIQIILLSSSLFITYPEIIFLPFILFFTLFFLNLRKFKNKNILNLIFGFVVFFILTIPAFETNYKFLYMSQIGQALRTNDWWGYFGAFILGKDNLILSSEFVNNMRNVSFNSIKEIINFISIEHFKNNFYFIHLNILPSIAGLYYILPGQINNNFEFLYSFILIIFTYIYLFYILYFNINYISHIQRYKKLFIYLFSINLLLIFILIYLKSYWTIIKLFTYIFPFIFIFLSINFHKNKINIIYLCIMFFFFIYKFSTFNSGIGRYDSFPSILNINLKKDVIWKIDSKKLDKCGKIKYLDNNYIRKAFINLKYLNFNNFQNRDNTSKINCVITFNNNKFKINYE